MIDQLNRYTIFADFAEENSTLDPAIAARRWREFNDGSFRYKILLQHGAIELTDDNQKTA